MTGGFYFVAFVDLLGQRKKLAGFKGVAPNTDEETKAFFETMAATGGVVRNVRKSVAEWFSPAKPISEQAVTNIPSERREQFRAIMNRAARQTGFSDSFVVAFPLRADGVEEDLSWARAAYDTWNALLGLSVMSLGSLAQGIPWRAGIDVGIGMEIFPNEVYGPALLNAYTLESTVAEWPRIVVGRGLLDYLNFLEQRPAAEPLDAFAGRMATSSREFICKSDDGWPMLHILSPAVMKAPGNWAERQSVAHQWVREQVAHVWSARDEKLFRRYTRLLHYFDAFARPRPSAPDSRG